MFRVTASCPTRIDLAGGTLDLWPLYHQLEKKATSNLAVDLRAEVELKASDSSDFIFESIDQKVRQRGTFEELSASKELLLLSLFLKALWREDLPPIHLKVKARSPKGAGLGGSSSLSIALAAAFFKAKELCDDGKTFSEEGLVSFAKDLESSVIKSPTGYQDYWAAVRGGLNLITYPYGRVRVETLSLGAFEALSEQLVLVYSGESRASALNNWSVYKSFFSGEEKTVKALRKIGELSFECMESLRFGDVQKALNISKAEWACRKEMWPDIVTERTEFINKFSCEQGAAFSRVCGAGGGGVMALFVESSRKRALLKKLMSEKIEVLETSVTKEGLKVFFDKN